MFCLPRGSWAKKCWVVFIAAGCTAADCADLSPETVVSRVLESEEARVEFLKTHAGQAVAGEGHLEATMPRAYYDSSVPDSNLAVALIQQGTGSKIVCGLARPLQRQEFGEITEGVRVRFSGDLVDAQNWGEWQTVYLGNCLLRRLDSAQGEGEPQAVDD